jgi:O-antigen ligase
MIGILQTVKNSFSAFKISFFFLMLFLVEVLVFQTQTGLFIFVATILLIFALLKPKYIYFLLIAFISVDGFPALQSVSYSKMFAAVLTVGLSMRLLLTKGSIPADDSYKYYLLFFFGGLVSFINTTNVSASSRIYITYISLFLLYIYTRYFLKNIRDIHKVLDYLFVCTVITFVYFQISGIAVYNVESDVPRVSGGIGDSNQYAMYILLLLPLALYRAMVSSGASKGLYVAYAFILFFMLIYTGSRGGVLGFFGASVIFIHYYGIGRLKSILLSLIVVTVILFSFVPKGYWERVATITAPQGVDSSKDVRTDNYRIALKMFIDNPISGVGLDNFKFRSIDYGIQRGGYVVHNTYLEILTGGGLLCFIPFVLILMNTWRKIKIKSNYEKNTRDLMVCLKASFVSLLITTFFISEDHSKIYWFFIALTSSVFYIANHNKYDKTSI